MAPSATETVTATERANTTFKVHSGDYKEVFAAKFKEEDERNGTGDHAPASVHISRLTKRRMSANTFP